MKRQDFSYHLSNELIARYPTENRTDSRLLCLDKHSGNTKHRQFSDFIELLQPNDLLVFNNTKVIPARLFGQKSTGGKVEILVERLLDDKNCLAHIRASKSPKAGAEITVGSHTNIIKVTGREDDLFQLSFIGKGSFLDFLNSEGRMPLPPYIDREDELSDQERYQTVYAQVVGAVAAPTAGLHFDDELLKAINKKGIDCGFVTLHVGAGTFQPVRADDIKDHKMHSERYEVTEKLCEQIRLCKKNKGRVITVGTTSVRCLESASSSKGEIQASKGETDIFITPDYDFKIVDALLTNFHLPESTLLMLVSAFAGRENILTAYQQAIDQKYRFFSYGDAMFLS